MIKNTLNIIGNGFDLYHGIQSSYLDFRVFLSETDNKFLEKMVEYFGCEFLWSDFEATLANLDTEQIFDECLTYLQSYGCDDWSDSYHHDFQYEIEQRIELITKTLKELFLVWILQLTISTSGSEKLIRLKREALFLSFNYTNTLESLYKIPFDNILYIHNKAINRNSNLIIGHSRKIAKKETLSFYDDEETDPRIAEGNKILDNYFKMTYKSTKEIISDNQEFFKKLINLKTINVFGHSLSVVDLPYFHEIVKNINNEDVRWNISYHSNEDYNNHIEKLKALGIKKELINLSTLDNMNNIQLSLFQRV